MLRGSGCSGMASRSLCNGVAQRSGRSVHCTREFESHRCQSEGSVAEWSKALRPAHRSAPRHVCIPIPTHKLLPNFCRKFRYLNHVFTRICQIPLFAVYYMDNTKSVYRFLMHKIQSTFCMHFRSARSFQRWKDIKLIVPIPLTVLSSTGNHTSKCADLK